MKNNSFLHLIVAALTAFVPTLASSQEDTEIRISEIKSTLWNGYILFTSPYQVSSDPNIHSVIVFDLPKGFGASIWNSSDLGSTAGNEFDWDLWWFHSFEYVDFEIGVGVWDVDPVFTNVSDILTAYVKLSKNVDLGPLPAQLYIKPRFYHTDASFLGNGWNVSLGFDTRIPLGDKLSLGLSPFLSFDDGFGVHDGANLGGNLSLNYSLTEKATIFATGSMIVPLTGDNETVKAFGVGVSIKF